MVLRFKRVAVTAGAVLIAAAVLVWSDAARDGVKSGIELCLGSILPSLFLFACVAMFVQLSGASVVLGKVVSPVFRVLFGLSGELATAFLLSCVSGYPVGARLLDMCYQNGRVHRAKAIKALMFSVNVGPAFAVVAVGAGVLGSTSDGWRLEAAHLLASVILAAIVRFLPDRIFCKTVQLHTSTHTNPTPQNQPSNSLTDAFVMSVNAAAKTMLSICGFAVFFAGVGGIIAQLPHGRVVQRFLEVTVGLEGLSRAQLPTVAFLLGFGGVSVIFQVMSAAKSIRPPLGLVVGSRLIHGGLSAGIIVMLEAVFPRSVSTGSFNVAVKPAVHTSPIAAMALVMLCIVLICFTQRAGKMSKAARSKI